METFIILFVLSLASKLRGQVILSHINGPALIANVSSQHTNSASVVNVIDANGKDQPLISEENYELYKNPVFITSAQDESSQQKRQRANEEAVNVYTSRISKNVADQESSFSINNVHKPTGHPYQHPLGEEEQINVGPGGILIYRGEIPRSQLSITNMHDKNGKHIYYSGKGKIINVSPAGIFIRKMQNFRNLYGDQNYYPGETIKVGPAGIFIQKVRKLPLNKKYPVSTLNENYYPFQNEIIDVGPNGISIQKWQSGGHENSSLLTR